MFVEISLTRYKVGIESINMFFTILILFVIFMHVFHRLTCGYARCVKCLVGKTAIVTGANCGIGFQISLILASKGCRVIMACRRDAEKQRLEIIRRTGNSNIETRHIDQSKFDSVRRFAQDIITTESRLDLLINNAGIGCSGPELTQDGFHETIQTNYLSPFLLTHLLEGLLAKSSPSRVVFTVSNLSYLGNLKDLGVFEKANYGNSEPYADSKLALVLACKIFAEKWKSLGIFCNVVHPGTIYTEIFKKSALNNKSMWFMVPLFRILTLIYGKSEWEGAQTTIYAACCEETKHDTGEFFMDCIRFIKPWQYHNDELCKKLWNYTVDCVKLDPSEKV